MRFAILFFASLLVATPSAAFDRYTAHGGPIKGLAYSTELNLLVSTSFDYTAVVWDTDSMTELKQLIGHNAAVNAATFSPNGQWLATAGDDNQILLWSVSDLKDPSVVPRPVALNGHTAKVIHLEFDDAGQRLLSSSWDRRVGLWDVANQSLIRFFQGHRGPVNAAQFMPNDDQIVSAGGDGHIRLWNISSGEYVRSLVRNGFGINVMELSAELNVIAFGGSNGVMKSISLDNSGPSVDLWVGGPPVLAVSIDRASEKLAFGTAEGRIVIADAVVGEIQHDFNAVKGPV